LYPNENPLLGKLESCREHGLQEGRIDVWSKASHLQRAKENAEKQEQERNILIVKMMSKSANTHCSIQKLLDKLFIHLH